MQMSDIGNGTGSLAMSVGITLYITMTAASIQAIKAALMSPARSLRHP